MAGFRSLFKVRQPGHGEKFEARVKSAIASARKMTFPSHDRSANSGGKKAVSKK
jgi:hypothetical protein